MIGRKILKAYREGCERDVCLTAQRPWQKIRLGNAGYL
jgi:hypothetical protein